MSVAVSLYRYAYLHGLHSDTFRIPTYEVVETMLQVFLKYVLNDSLQSVLIVGCVVLGHDGYFVLHTPKFWVAQLVQRLTTGQTIRGSNPGVGEIFLTCPDRPWGPPSLLYNEYRIFPGCKERPGRDVDPSPPSSAVVKKEQSYTSTLPMGRMDCTRVHFTFYLLHLTFMSFFRLF